MKKSSCLIPFSAVTGIWAAIHCLLPIAIGITFSVYAQDTGWQWLNPLPQGNYLNDAVYTSSGKYLTVGRYGTILMSSDDGVTWTSVASQTKEDLNAIHFTNGSLGIIAGDEVILKTTDGGLTWSKKKINGDAFFKTFTDVFMVNETVGYGVMQGGTISKTTDGGENWNQLTNNAGGGASLESVWFTSADKGFAVGWEGTIVSTSDGGVTWDTTHAGSSVLKSVTFINSLTGFAVASVGEIYKTTDGGVTWTNKASLPGSRWVEEVIFSSSTTGFGIGWDEVGSTGSVIKTTDGGESWQEIDMGLPATTFAGRIFFSAAFKDSNNGIMVGNWGQMYATSNGGTSWKALHTGTNEWFTDGVVVTDSDAYITGITDKLMKTTNGGDQWSTVDLKITGLAFGIQFLNQQKGLVIAVDGEKSVLLKTDDRGSTWTKKVINSNTYRSLFFTDENKGVIVGDNGKLARTTDGGVSWTENNFATTQWLNDVFFTTADKGFAVGDSSIILKTTDGGVNWTFSSSGAFDRYTHVQFTSENTGYIAGGYGKFLKTTDAGNNWANKFPANFFEDVRSFHFTDDNNGYFCTTTGRIFKTGNGANTWKELSSGTYNILEDIFFINSQKGFAVGEGGTILRTTTGGAAFAKSEAENAVVKIYPNPTSGKVYVEVYDRLKHDTEFRVYDLFGRELYRQMNIRENKFIVDLHSLHEGLYLYHIADDKGMIGAGKICVGK